jgi:hypothetical protein
MFALLMAVALPSCTTAEYRAANGACRIELTQKIPPKLRTVRYEGVRSEQVPDGNVWCSRDRGKLHCWQGTRTIEIPYVDYQTVDDMATLRDEKIDQCTRERCATAYGNMDCKKA